MLLCGWPRTKPKRHLSATQYTTCKRTARAWIERKELIQEKHFDRRHTQLGLIIILKNFMVCLIWGRIHKAFWNTESLQCKIFMLQCTWVFRLEKLPQVQAAVPFSGWNLEKKRSCWPLRNSLGTFPVGSIWTVRMKLGSRYLKNKNIKGNR